MKKTIRKIAAATAILLVILSVKTFAQDNQVISVGAFKGTFNYCDTPTQRVVVKGVYPVAPTPESARTAREAEYLEISVAPEGIFFKDGTKLSINYLNDYADSEVWFVIAKTQNGNLTIPYFTFK